MSMDVLGTRAADESGRTEDANQANRLPFHISVATRAEMDMVAQMRASTYGRHLPDLGQRLAQAEAADFEPGCEVLVATSKLDASLLGTLRIHSNVLKPLPMEASVTLPAMYAGARMAEATRLCVKGSPNSSMVRNALFKAFFLYCVEQHVDWLMAVGRNPVDRLYDALMFKDVGEPGLYIPMAHVGHVPHRAMSLLTEGAEPMWMQSGHPLYQFMVLTEHADISLSGALSLDGLHTSARSARPLANSPGRLVLAASNDQPFQPALAPAAKVVAA